MLSVLRYARSLLGVALALLLAGGATAPAAIVPEGPRLAVVKWSLFPDRTDLETIDGTGAQPLRVLGGGPRKRPLPEVFIQPAWSPDGQRIVFSGLARTLNDGPRGTRLYVSGADGTGLHPLLGTHGADEPLVAPNGATVAFTRYQSRLRINRRGEEESIARGASIWVTSLTGGAPRRLTPARDGLYMYPESFSPDGDTLLVSRGVGGRPWDVVAMHLSTRQTEVLLRNALDPIYSPDGSRIAFLRWHRMKVPGGRHTTAADLFTVRAGGGGLRPLTSSRLTERYASWDPSGERLAFVLFPPEVGELASIGFGGAVMQVNADGTCLRTVLEASPLTAFYGTVWQPGPGREAGRIEC